MKVASVRKAGFAVMSAFIVWHAVGVSLVGPLPDSELRKNLMEVYGYYLAFFHLDSTWMFYAPNPSFGSILRYETLNSRGEKSVFPLSESHGKFDHAYSRYTNFYGYLFAYPKYARNHGYHKSVARYLCGQHQKSEEIVQIRFFIFRQQRFTKDDYLKGKHPLDNEFLKKGVSRAYKC